MRKQIVFTEIGKAELQEAELPDIKKKEVLVKTDYTVVSGGTERACILGMNNTSQKFAMSLEYCGVGRVMQVGENVKSVKTNDRVLVYHGIHSNYNIRTEEEITKAEHDKISSVDAAFVIIASMSLGGVRKLEIELGESAMVMGQGLLGLFATQFLRLSGANPVIAADPDPERRKLALKLGADYVFDPLREGFAENVLEVTKGKGINGCVEVTGVSSAMNTALDCAARMGRISLLGCTRNSDSSVDYCRKVHKPGITLIGAHNFVRPKVESYPHHWTHHDDCHAVLDMIASGRIQVRPLVSRIVSPVEAPKIYRELCYDKTFPVGTVFDWRDIE